MLQAIQIATNKSHPYVLQGWTLKKPVTIAMKNLLNDCVGGFTKASNILNKGLIIHLLLYHINWFLITSANSPLPNTIQK